MRLALFTPPLISARTDPIRLWHQIAGSTALIFGKSEKLKTWSFAAYEQPLKWMAFGLGFASTICVVQGWTFAAMLFSLPFCLIWIFCAWLHGERQLKYINVMFTALYVYGIARHVVLGG